MLLAEPQYITEDEIPDDLPVIRPQPGPQTAFMKCPADGIVFGGSAFGGKTYAELMEASRYSYDPTYTGIIFRRKTTEITTPGGLWDTAQEVYSCSNCYAELTAHNLMATFGSGAKVKFAHLEHEKTKYDHHGGQYVFIGFDELTTFTRSQFFYLLTRNRPGPGCVLRPYWRATTNPDADSWVRELIDWWIDEDTGFAIPERDGVLRHYTMENDEIVWVGEDWRDEDGLPPRSMTFIRSKLEDNQEGLKRDPYYAANLRAQDRVTRQRLLEGNWNISYRGGMFDPTWFIVEDNAPRMMKRMRYWDFAATEKVDEDKEPDFTAGALGGMDEYGELWIEDMEHFQESPGEAERRIKQCAIIDGPEVAVGLEEEKGSSGKYMTSHMQREVLKGYEVHPDPVSGDKVSRAKPWCALAERGGVHLVRGPWVRKFLAEAGSFPLAKKDQIDAVSGLYKLSATTKRVLFSYLPWGGRHGHKKSFKKSRLDFEAVSPDELVLFIVLYAEKDTGIVGACYCWSRRSKKLRIYNELVHPTPLIPALIEDIREKAVVPIAPEGPQRRLCIDRIYGNDQMMKGGFDMKKALKKGGVRLRPNPHYDLAGSVIELNRMFANGQITLHPDCTNMDIQVRTWKVENEKPNTKPGFGLCQTLCIVASELKTMGELAAPAFLRPYGKERQRIREQLYSKGVSGGPMPTTQKTGDEWLAR